MYISPIFKDKKLGELEARWGDVFNANDFDVETDDDYRELMAETFPILYKAWTDPSGMVSKEIAALLCTVSKAFAQCWDDEGNFIGNPVYETAAFFHDDFIFSFVFQNKGYSFNLNDDGIIRIETEDDLWEVDSKTFELPENPFIDND